MAISFDDLKDKLNAALEKEDASWKLTAEEFTHLGELENWSQSSRVRDVWVLSPTVQPGQTLGADTIPDVAHRIAIMANVCAANDLCLRPIGHHEEGFSMGRLLDRDEDDDEIDEHDRLHNWSPINIFPEHRGNKVVYLSFQSIRCYGVVNGSLHTTPLHISKADKVIRTYCGEFMYHVGQMANAQELTIPIAPAPHVLSLGGVLAISGHGSRLSASDSSGAGDVTRDWPGTLSASVDAATVIEWTGTKYEAVRLDRGDDKLALAAASLGRLIVVDVTLRCLDDYALRLEYLKVKPDRLFDADESKENSLKWLMKRGSFEVLAFRNVYSSERKKTLYVAHWNRHTTDRHPAIPAKPIWDESVRNPIADLFGSKTMGIEMSLDLLDKLPWKLVSGVVRQRNNQEVRESCDNPFGPAAKMRMYAHSDAPPVTASGYCLVVPQSEVQELAQWAYHWANDPLDDPYDDDDWGVHRYLTFECRCADLDDNGLPAGAKVPLLSTAAPLEYKADGTPKTLTGDDKRVVVWISVLSLNNPKTVEARGYYYRDMEEALFEKVKAENAKGKNWRIRPEWAKGWMYEPESAWKKPVADFHKFFEAGWAGDENQYGSWKFACKLAWQMDPHGLVSTDFHERLLPKPPGHTTPAKPTP